MSEKKWQEGMNEISGFGGSYEQGCRAMFLAGIKWIDEHPNANPIVQEMSNIFGITKNANKDAEELEKAILNARCMMEDGREVRCGDECTGAMIHAVQHHLMYYRKFGWDKYVEMMSKKENKL